LEIWLAETEDENKKMYTWPGATTPKYGWEQEGCFHWKGLSSKEQSFISMGVRNTRYPFKGYPYIF